MESHKQSKLAEDFATGFARTKENIRKEIEELSESSCTDVTGSLNLISERIHELSKTLQDSTIFLPSYSVKVRQNEIRTLESELKVKENLLIPKKKFGFKSKVSKPDPPAAPVSESSADVGKTTAGDDSNFLTIESVDGPTVTYCEELLNKPDVLVRNLENVVLHLNGSPSTLRIAKLKNCKLICGPVHTSVFVDECTDCLLFLCCQQLRTHSSNGLDIYLRVRSRAIIEDCKNIRFAPYSWSHPKSEELHQQAEIDYDMERFDCVDDFNWLAFTTPSPNWSVLPEVERVQFPSEPEVDGP